MIWNLCDFPAGVVPFGTESGKNISSFNDEGDMFLKIAKKVIGILLYYLTVLKEYKKVKDNSK